MATSRAEIERRFFAKVEKTPTCWLWNGSSNGRGYGELRIDRVKRYAHRVSHELFVGPIPAELQIDHLCRTPGCVRPDHLEAVPARINILRSGAPDAQRRRHAAKTHCPQSHPYDETNTYIDRKNRRHCKTCTLARTKEARNGNRPDRDQRPLRSGNRLRMSDLNA